MNHQIRGTRIKNAIVLRLYVHFCPTALLSWNTTCRRIIHTARTDPGSNIIIDCLLARNVLKWFQGWSNRRQHVPFRSRAGDLLWRWWIDRARCEKGVTPWFIGSRWPVGQCIASWKACWSRSSNGILSSQEFIPVSRTRRMNGKKTFASMVQWRDQPIDVTNKRGCVARA